MSPCQCGARAPPGARTAGCGIRPSFPIVLSARRGAIDRQRADHVRPRTPRVAGATRRGDGKLAASGLFVPVLGKWARSRPAGCARHIRIPSSVPVSGALMPTVSAHVAATLALHIDHVFGVMGNGNAYFLDALERSTDVGYTAVRHEAGGVVAADAYHRAGGGLAAATATYGAGFTNTLTALAEAVQAHVPARARRRRRADVGPPPLGRRPDRPRLGGRRAHLHGGPSGCRGDDGHRDRARADLSRAHRARDPLRRRRARGGARARCARTPSARAGRAARPVRRPGDPRCRRRAGRGEAPVPARRARGVDRRGGRGARRPRRRDRGAHRLDGARTRRLPPARVRSRRDRRVRRRSRDGAGRAGRRRRRVRRVAQPVHDALRRALRPRHARVPGRSRARGDPPARRRLHPRGCRPRRPRDRRRARGPRRSAQRVARERGCGIRPRVRTGRRPGTRRTARPALGRGADRRAAAGRPGRGL